MSQILSSDFYLPPTFSSPPVLLHRKEGRGFSHPWPMHGVAAGQWAGLGWLGEAGWGSFLLWRSLIPTSLPPSLGRRPTSSLGHGSGQGQDFPSPPLLYGKRRRRWEWGWGTGQACLLHAAACLSPLLSVSSLCLLPSLSLSISLSLSHKWSPPHHA